MDPVLRRMLIEGLRTRGWTHLDGERAAESVAGLYQDGAAEWGVWLSKVAGEPDVYRVARGGNVISFYDSPLEGRARDVAGALNEVEWKDSDATGTH